MTPYDSATEVPHAVQNCTPVDHAIPLDQQEAQRLKMRTRRKKVVDFDANTETEERSKDGKD
eukprot:2092581-Rhodomonas_salina.2